MNKQLTWIVVVVVVIVVVAGVLYLNRKNTASMNMPSQSTSTQTGTRVQSPTGSVSSAPMAAGDSVTIQNFAFSPASLTVKVGDKVTWTNQDSVGHSATADDSSFDTGVLQQGQSGSVTFSKAGTYTYHCSVHPNMHGTIIVQ